VKYFDNSILREIQRADEKIISSLYFSFSVFVFLPVAALGAGSQEDQGPGTS
jgi:hypothetical protein